MPENLRSHPLKGKKVCRKCNSECVNCFGSGAKLHTQCEQCRNFYSEISLECVSNCSVQRNEYLLEGTKTCKACNVECKSGAGCFGSGVNQCNECRAYKLAYNDAKRFIEFLGTLKSKESELSSQMSNSLNTQLEFYKEIIKNFNNNSNSKDLNEDNIVFCVSECPTIMPYKTGNLFCTDNKKSQ